MAGLVGIFDSDAYNNGYLKSLVSSLGGALIFAGLIIYGFIQQYLADPQTGWYPAMALIILIITGIAYYYLRRWQLRRLGIDITVILKRVEEY